MSETKGIVSPALKLLHAAGIWAERCNSGAVRRRGRMVTFGIGDGSPDILVVDQGRAIAIEAKGSHADECGCDSCASQRKWRDRWTAAGCFYFRIRKPESVLVIVHGLRGKL